MVPDSFRDEVRPGSPVDIMVNGAFVVVVKFSSDRGIIVLLAISELLVEFSELSATLALDIKIGIAVEPDSTMEVVVIIPKFITAFQLPVTIKPNPIDGESSDNGTDISLLPLDDTDMLDVLLEASRLALMLELGIGDDNPVAASKRATEIICWLGISTIKWREKTKQESAPI